MKRILVIEDEPHMRRNLLTILQLEGFEPIGAEDGVVGVERARTENPDLILCDVMMPKLDGYGVLAQLQADPATAAIPFVFLTAKGEKVDLRSGMNLGADDYLTKPVTTEELINAIRARLNRKEKHQAHWRGKLDAHLRRPKFTSPAPLQTLGLTPREAEVLFWVAQGKTNSEIGIILGIRLRTVKKHVEHIFGKLHVETRNAAGFCALETLTRANDAAM
ncbi:MAG: response regulator transcription factor [Verrucomicrobiota bacterium]